MSTENQNKIPEEIDLGELINKVGNFFNSVVSNIFKAILFIQKKLFLFIALIIIGGGIGYFLDTQSKIYNSEIIVSPNMGGTDYLYSKIDLLKSKLREGDKGFFKSIGIMNSDKIASIEVEPIIDIYNFVNNSTSAASAQNTQNFELVKLLAESSDINKVIKEELTSKNYPHHKILITTNNKTSENELTKPLLRFLNTDEYLNKILEVSKENILIKMEKNKELISQTDSLIRILTVNLTKNQKSSNLVYNNENNQFNSFFDLKNSLINEIANQKIALINSNVVIKDISTVTNIINTKGVNNKLKLILPILLIFGYLFSVLFISFYSSQKAKLSK